MPLHSPFSRPRFTAFWRRDAWRRVALAAALCANVGLAGCESRRSAGPGDVASDATDAGRDGEVDARVDALVDAQVDGDAPDTSGGAAMRCPDDVPGTVRPAGWTVAGHCRGAAPDYALLFDDAAVQRLDLTIAPSDYAAMMADLESMLGPFGGGPQPPGPVADRDPIWVPVTVRHGGLVWEHVGMRFKGNSSLRSSWQMGIGKLAFRLTFDKFEDQAPEWQDQRFYGFKKMTFSNGFVDPSLMRDKLAADLMREAGVPAARGAFARVFVDVGQGSVYYGLYAMVEDPSDELLGEQFTDDTGNLYKPDGPTASWDRFDPADFEKKTNESLADWSDLEAAWTALHADRTDAAAWRAQLEQRFDVDGFLRWLAMNQAMVNWDAYGFMTHNYYVYANPGDGGRLAWIPWDLNEALMRRDVPNAREADSVMLDAIDARWPLIRFLLDDAEYRTRYKAALQVALDGTLAVAAVEARAQSYHQLIAPFVTGVDGEKAPYTFLRSPSEFDQSLRGGQNAILDHLAGRHADVAAALAADGGP